MSGCSFPFLQRMCPAGGLCFASKGSLGQGRCGSTASFSGDCLLFLGNPAISSDSLGFYRKCPREGKLFVSHLVKPFTYSEAKCFQSAINSKTLPSPRDSQKHLHFYFPLPYSVREQNELITPLAHLLACCG